MRPSRYATLLWSGWPDTRRLFTPAWRAVLEDAGGSDGGFRVPDGFEEWDRFHQLQYVEFKTRLPSFINMGLDRSSMAHSVEPRVPFLDHELVELGIRIPRRLRKRSMEKHVLRRAMEPHLPKEIVWREKRGLLAPEPQWDDEVSRPPAFAEELLSDPVLEEKGYFDPRAVRSAREFGARKGGPIAHALATQLLDEMFVQGRTPSQVDWGRPINGSGD
jgi:asparagine synthase (glutamine-hydrolysing)